MSTPDIIGKYALISPIVKYYAFTQQTLKIVRQTSSSIWVVNVNISDANPKRYSKANLLAVVDTLDELELLKVKNQTLCDSYFQCDEDKRKLVDEIKSMGIN